MAAYRRFMTHITCRLTAKNLDQLQNRTLGNRVLAPLPLPLLIATICARFHEFDTVEKLEVIYKESLTTA